ncbi:hypothetical protein ES703_114035 [subsurface metagenome]
MEGTITKDKEIAEQIIFEQTLQPLIGVELAERCPLTGRITTVTMTCPVGGDNVVQVAFGHGSKKLCPTNDYIPLHGDSPPFTDINEPVGMNERLWCEILNGDDTYPHLVTVAVIIVGKYGGGVGEEF